MQFVHVFIASGRFSTFEQMRAFIDETYSEDGDGVPSDFMMETGLSEYEPACIEAVVAEDNEQSGLHDLLRGCSYWEKWLTKLDGTIQADSAICVFPPNELATPSLSSLEYLGGFQFHDE